MRPPSDRALPPTRGPHPENPVSSNGGARHTPAMNASARDRVAQASREVAADAATVFELIADPEQQPSWDGNGNLASAPAGQRIRAVGDVFEMTLTRGQVRHNEVVEFVEGRLIAWRPFEPGTEPPGHLWRWELLPIDDQRTLATHTYDWTGLNDPSRFGRARSTTPARLLASLDRLADAAEGRAPDRREGTGPRQ
jgi:uncharacterized protein YndB with AHSA1/START domain